MAGHDPFARATQRTPFTRLVRVEFRKLTGTLSDRILLVIGPLALVGLTALMMAVDTDTQSAKDQALPVVWSARFAHVVVHALIIKLIAGEWQHRSAQPTLLAQPSRGRYFAAQAVVVMVLWLLCLALQIMTTFIAMPISVAAAGNGYLLDYRVGWVIGMAVVGSLMSMVVALTVGMLLPNSAGALAVYCGAVPAMLIMSGLVPEALAWIDPATPALTLATLLPIEGPAPALVSVVLWVALLGLAGYRVARRDVA
ncbi:hypothetical protein [Actinokineospora pegani]|uniref:hypothetical protein n=1 Tax=Actinokineospora pegani TaxID=2654637 RepID=UPI0012EA7F78|nr:hypothetical protein [Actinokineospora pegani]